MSRLDSFAENRFRNQTFGDPIFRSQTLVHGSAWDYVPYSGHFAARQFSAGLPFRIDEAEGCVLPARSHRLLRFLSFTAAPQFTDRNRASAGLVGCHCVAALTWFASEFRIFMRRNAPGRYCFCDYAKIGAACHRAGAEASSGLPAERTTDDPAVDGDRGT